MSKFTFILIYDLKRAVLSVPFFLSVISITSLVFFAAYGQLSSIADATYLLIAGLGGSGTIIMIICLLPIIPYSMVFAEEWQQNATKFWMIRTGVNKYTTSKLIASGLSAFLTTFLGLTLFLFITTPAFSFFTYSRTGDAYSPLLDVSLPLLYNLLFISHYALSAMIFSFIAMFISTYIPNKFVVLASPVLIYFILHRFTALLNIPEYLKAVNLVEGIFDAGSPLNTFILKLFIVLIICLLLSVSTLLQVRRRVQHD